MQKQSTENLVQGRIRELDGLRGVAIALVLVSHYAGGDIVPGGLGVTLFFVLSGFIITRLFLLELDKTGTVSVQKFYLRRFLRLTPALYVSVAVAAGLTLAWSEKFSMVPVLAALTYLKNYQTLFLPDNIGHPLAVLGITWSLAVEEHFYLVFPLLFIAFRAQPSQFIWLLAAMLVAALLWRFYLVHVFDVPTPRTYTASDTRFDSPLTGALLACLCARWERGTGKPPEASMWHLIAGVAVITATLLWRDAGFRETLRYSIQNIGCALIIYGAVFGVGLQHIRKPLAYGPLNLLGIISYSVYLWHFIALEVAGRMAPAGSGTLAVAVLAALILLPAAILSWQFLEKGTERFRTRLGLDHAGPDQERRISAALPLALPEGGNLPVPR